ncbi:MAG: hypothetical protein JSV85_07885 [Candidatus Bathyarchaeota archaeon]|nr:MAG: hypothetical protein JSV85_07885 [Candidatus Bathyarchaeota archaeon]
MNGKKAVKCDSCGVAMHFAQKVPFRIMGQDGLAVWVFGGVAQLKERTLSFDIYLCPKCGRIEMFADDVSRRFLLKMTPGTFFKRCVKCGREIPMASEECPHCEATQKRS